MSQRQAELIVSNVVGAVVRRIKAGETIRLQGLGVFQAVVRPARRGRDPRTGAPIEISARRRVVYRPSQGLITPL